MLTSDRRLEIRCFVVDASRKRGPLKVTAELLDDRRIVASGTNKIDRANGPRYDVSLSNLGVVELWDLRSPKLYQVRVRLFEGDRCIDHFDTRTGLRDARFTADGFFLNDKHAMRSRRRDRARTGF